MTTAKSIRAAQSITWNELEQRGNGWNVSGDVPFYVLRRGTKRAVYFKREDLDALDPRLAPLLDRLLAGHTQENISATIAATLRLWRNAPSIQVTCMWNRKKYFDRLNRVLDIDRENRFVRLEGDTAVVAEESGVTFAKPWELNEVHSLSFEHLDGQFPGGSARIEAAVALNLTNEETVAFIFSESDTVTSELPGDICPS
jgi:hypothetical protein